MGTSEGIVPWIHHCWVHAGLDPSIHGVLLSTLPPHGRSAMSGHTAARWLRCGGGYLTCRECCARGFSPLATRSPDDARSSCWTSPAATARGSAIRAQSTSWTRGSVELQELQSA